MDDSVKEPLADPPRIVERGLPLDEAWEEVEDEFEDFHPAWRQRQCLINCWLCLTIMLLLFCPLGLIGGLLAFIGASLYVCRCCRPRIKSAGLTASKSIFLLAVLASLLDALILAALVTVGVLFIVNECKDKEGNDLAEDACTVRKVVGIAVLCMAFVAFIHLLMSVSVFFSMRTCHHHMHVSECKRVKAEKERSKGKKSKKSKRKHKDKHKHRSRDEASTSFDPIQEPQESAVAAKSDSVVVVVEEA